MEKRRPRRDLIRSRGKKHRERRGSVEFERLDSPYREFRRARMLGFGRRLGPDQLGRVDRDATAGRKPESERAGLSGDVCVRGGQQISGGGEWMDALAWGAARSSRRGRRCRVFAPESQASGAGPQRVNCEHVAPPPLAGTTLEPVPAKPKAPLDQHGHNVWAHDPEAILPVRYLTLHDHRRRQRGTTVTRQFSDASGSTKRCGKINALQTPFTLPHLRNDPRSPTAEWQRAWSARRSRAAGRSYRMIVKRTWGDFAQLFAITLASASAHVGSASRRERQRAGMPSSPVYAATIPPTTAAVVSTSPPASTHAVIAAG